MENRGVLFIPDISGFTRFVNEIEIEHSRHIIQQLLETLINANETGLEISEIEGDAILFYKFGEPLPLEVLYAQVEKMFLAFHKHLNVYDNRKICQCKACVSAVYLTLKIITHYGEFAFYNVKQFKKLIGKDVIVAHQLLKNDIAQHEYWLVTKGLLQENQPAELAQWMHWKTSHQNTENGNIDYHYTQLGPLKDKVTADEIPKFDLSKKTKMVSVSRDYDIHVKRLVFTVVHFDLRHLWFPGIKEVTEIEHFLPGIGTRHKHILVDGSERPKYISGFYYDPETKTTFSETDEKNKSALYFIVEKTGEDTTRVTIEFYLPPVALQQVFFKLLHRKKMERDLTQALQQLDKLAKEVIIPLEF